MLNNRIYDMVREEIENRTDTDVIEQKCAELHEKIQSLKDEIRSIQTEKCYFRFNNIHHAYDD